MRSSRAYAAATHVVLLLGLVGLLAPSVWMVGISLKAPGDVFKNMLNPVPMRPTFGNYAAVFEKTQIPRQFLNSVIFAVGVTLGQLIMAIPAAYALARKRTRLSNGLFSALLLTLPIPFVVEYVPNYILMSNLNLLNTFLALIVPQIANVYGIFLLRQHFRAFPTAIIEAARIDGCSEVSVLRRVVIPANRPAIAALAVYVFITTWNEYVWPLLVAPSEEMQVMTVSVANFATGEGGVQWGNIMAAATLATIPTIAVYLVLRRQVIAAFLEGALKG